MRIILISLPSPFENTPPMDVPLGLAYISSYLKKKGFNDITLIDYNLLEYDYYVKDDYLKEIPLDADVYGISVTTPQFIWFCKITQYLKQAGNGVIVSGGPHVSSRPDECLGKTETDFVIVGEGEIAFNRLLNGHNVSRFKRNIVPNLDLLPFPDRTLIDQSYYKRTIDGERAFHIITSRDCPFNCSFCSKKAVGRNIRFRSVENVMKEIDLDTKEYGITKYVLYDDTFTINKERAMKIAREFGKRKIKWRCFSRVDTVNREVLKTFRDNGLSSITFGVETFSQKMLDIYNKGTTVEQNKTTLLLCKELGIPVRCSLIYGGPQETLETLQETIHGIKQTQPDEWNIATFVPIPGSDIGDNPEKYSINILPDPCYMKYHRVGESGMGEILIKTPTMNEKEYLENRKWFVEELERVSPRRNIQDTIQTLKLLAK